MNKVAVSNIYIVILVAIFIVLTFTILPTTSSANHARVQGAAPLDVPINTDRNPCQVATDQPALPGAAGTTGDGSGEVPVYDDDANQNLSTIVSILGGAGSIGSSNELQNRQARVLLELLCEKEYEEDHSLQHAWRQVIDSFVETVHSWVLLGNNLNPIFLQNQQVYYELVDDEVLLTLLQEIEDSNIGIDAKRAMIANLLINRFTSVFPYNGAVEWAADDVADALSQNFVRNGGWVTFRGQQGPCNSSQSCMELAEAEYEKRRASQRSFEEEKLAWGRGFFSYEYCNNGNTIDPNTFENTTPDEPGLYSQYDTDRRNCYIVTPGSLIQDQVTHVFGSALRQMELNDEYEEWIGRTSLAVLGSVVTDLGLDPSGAGGYPYNRFVESTVADASTISPDDAQVDIRTVFSWNTRDDTSQFARFGPDDLVDLLPSEFAGNGYIDPQNTTAAARNQKFVERLEDLLDDENLPNI